MSATEFGYTTEYVECDRCDGDGELYRDLFVADPCWQCGGTGTIEVCGWCLDSGEDCVYCGWRAAGSGGETPQ